MEYTHENLTLSMLKHDDGFQGQCCFYIPWDHKEFLKDTCGVDKNPRWDGDIYEHLFEHQYGEIYVDPDEKHYYCNSPDLLIAYMSWALSREEKITIQAEYSHFYWGIHDIQHAIHDESGCTVYISGDIERERLIDAFKVMNELGHYPSYKMIEEITTDFERRFSMPIDLTEFLQDDEWY